MRNFRKDKHSQSNSDQALRNLTLEIIKEDEELDEIEVEEEEEFLDLESPSTKIH